MKNESGDIRFEAAVSLLRVAHRNLMNHVHRLHPGAQRCQRGKRETDPYIANGERRRRKLKVSNSNQSNRSLQTSACEHKRTGQSDAGVGIAGRIGGYTLNHNRIERQSIDFVFLNG